jgi:hypothetical protein
MDLVVHKSKHSEHKYDHVEPDTGSHEVEDPVAVLMSELRLFHIPSEGHPQGRRHEDGPFVVDGHQVLRVACKGHHKEEIDQESHRQQVAEDQLQVEVASY